MNLRALRTFVTMAQTGSLGRAARQLNVSQPAASRQIHTLQDELGVRLFRRSGRRLQLTLEGDDLLRQSHRLLADVDSLVERARALKGGQTGTLKVAATAQFITALLAPFLPGYRRNHPGIDVELVEGNAAIHRIRLEHGEVHLAIMPATGRRFSHKILAPVHVMAVIHKSHRLSRRATLEVSELLNERLLLMQREYHSRAWFEAACEAGDVQPKILLQSATANTLVELAAVNYGIAIVPSTTIIRDPALRAVPLVQSGKSIGQWSMVCWDEQRPTPTYARSFIEELVIYSKQAFPGQKLLRQAPTLQKPFSARYPVPAEA